MTIHILIPVVNGLMAASDGEGAVEFDGPFVRLPKIVPIPPNRALLALGRYLDSGPHGVFNLLDEFEIALQSSGIDSAVNHCQSRLQSLQLPRTFNENINTVVVLSASGLQSIEFNYEAPNSVNVVKPQIPEPMPLNHSMMIGPQNRSTPRWSELIPPEHLIYFSQNAKPIEDRTKDEALMVVRSVLPAARQISYHELREVPISDIFDAYFLTADSVECVALAESF